MSKAEERALEKYPKMSRITEHHGIIPADYESHYLGDANEEKREGFIEGYQQAEKDLELSLEDIPKIFQISEELKTSWWFRDNEQTKLIGTQTFWEEVLKRFKEKR
jgi:hypothetical protein